MLRDYFHDADDDTIEKLNQTHLLNVNLTPDAPWMGKPLDELALAALDVQAMSLRRANGRVANVHEGHELAAGDTLVLSGLPEPLALAESRLLHG